NPVESAAKGGEALQIRLTIALPAEVKQGGYWCALTIDELPDPLTSTTSGVAMRFLASVSTGIYVHVGTVERGADITSIDVRADDIVVEMKNIGNAPANVEGRFEFLKPGTDRPVAVVSLDRNILLPEPVPTSRFAAKMPDARTLPSGRYVVRLIVEIGLDHYLGAQRELDIQRSRTGG